MIIKNIPLELDYLANCYILTDEKTGESALVDPGLYTDELKNYIKNEKPNLKYILLTHGHFDHIFGAYPIREETGAKIVISKYDESCLSNENDNLLEDSDFSSFKDKLEPYFTPCNADITVDDGDEIVIGESKLRVMATPGHSAGGVCYIDKESRFIISGDTLFYKYVGRADKGSRNPEELRISCLKLVSLEGDYDVYPGHGPSTNLATERTHNFFIRRFRGRQG